MREKIEQVIENLQHNGMKASFFDTTDQAKKYILETIGNGKDVGIGGSMTIMDMKLHESIKDAGNQVHWHWLVSTPEERTEAVTKANRADVYLTSANAITLQGEVVNVDGNGNRVSAMIYGPKKVIIIGGINKICNDSFEAMDRLRKDASPPNAKRLNRKTPCVTTGECRDCNSPERICNVTTIIHKKPGCIGEMEIIIVGEELGY
ncbi:lactate utilization protein [Anaerosolibacter sp.]|uniref:lactate utilization protein n=1 Tax=Anaerosolibacter sp. TaxID=1872527 RepID=UPI0039EF943E